MVSKTDALTAFLILSNCKLLVKAKHQPHVTFSSRNSQHIKEQASGTMLQLFKVCHLTVMKALGFHPFLRHYIVGCYRLHTIHGLLSYLQNISALHTADQMVKNSSQDKPTTNKYS